MNRDIQLILADCDGTILDNNGTLDPELKSVVDQLAKKNIRFTLASGRGLELITPIVESFELHYPYVCDNGGNIYQDGKTVTCNCIPQTYTNKILRRLYKEEVPFFCFTTSGGYYNLTSPRFDKIKKMFKGRLELIPYDPKHDYDNEPTFKITMDTRYHKNIDIVVKEVSDMCPNMNFKPSEGTLYTITALNATKGEGVKQIAELMNVSLDHVMVFGDNFNDVSMFKVAKESVAVASADDKVRKEATYVCLSNDEFGVSKFLKEYFDLN